MSEYKTTPNVTVLILNWNGQRFLQKCLQAVKNQTYQDYEILVVDNASEDGSVDGLEELHPGVRVLRLKSNTGFAIGNNLGVQHALGNWVAFLNNDAFPRPGWLEAFVREAEQFPEYTFFASKIIRADRLNILDGAGIILHSSCLAWNWGHNEPDGDAFKNPQEVFGTCAAAALINRQVFQQVGGFDEDFGSYFEDVDLSFRLQRIGARCLYVPEAVVEHVGSASFGIGSERSILLLQRNWIWTFVKNMPGRLFWKYLPVHLLTNFVFLLYYVRHRHGMVYFRAKGQAIKGLGKALRKRKGLPPMGKEALERLDGFLNRGWFSPFKLGRQQAKVRKLENFLQRK